MDCQKKNASIWILNDCIPYIFFFFETFDVRKKSKHNQKINEPSDTCLLEYKGLTWPSLTTFTTRDFEAEPANPMWVHFNSATCIKAATQIEGPTQNKYNTYWHYQWYKEGILHRNSKVNVIDKLLYCGNHIKNLLSRTLKNCRCISCVFKPLNYLDYSNQTHL